MQNAAQIVDFQRADAFIMPNTVNRCTADIVCMRQRVRTLLRLPQSLPKRRVYNHSITTTMVFSNHILDNSYNNDYNKGGYICFII